MTKKRVIIVGCSRLGSTLAAKMSLAGEDVVLLDKKESSFRKLPDGFAGFQLVGDGTDVDTLEYAGIRDAKMILCTTDDDNVNLLIAQLADKIYEVNRVYIRLADSEKSKLLENTNIVAVYPFHLSVGAFEELISSDD